MKSLLLNSIVYLLLVTAASAFQIDKKLPDARQEQQAEELFTQIRCLVCAGESLADSNAEIAVDMRGLIRKKIAAGQTTEEIKKYLVGLYGERILQQPPIKPNTYLLWLFPLLMIIIGFLAIKKNVHGRNRANKKTN